MHRFLFCCALAFLLPWTACGQSAPGLSAAQSASVDAAVEAERARQRAVGVAVGIIREGEIVYLHGYGWANAETQAPVTTHTLFRWASISKTLTAVAAMQLAERHALDLDADVRGYVPEFPDKGMVITPRFLLCHQSGIPHYSNGRIVATPAKYTMSHPFDDPVVALDKFKDSPLLFVPGDRFSYSTYGFLLLGAVVQRAGRQPFAEQIRDRIAKPLGLESLQPDYQWKAIPDRASGYVLKDGNVVPSTDTDVAWKLPGGGFLSDVQDLARWAQALVDRRLLSAATYETMWQAQRDAHGRLTDYGLGFGVQRQSTGRLKVWHDGQQEKATCRMVLYPDQRSAIVVMTNSEFAQPGKISTAIYSALDRAKDVPAPRPGDDDFVQPEG